MSNPIIVQDTLRRLATVNPLLHEAFEVMAYGLTETSKRQYRHSFEAWGAWCVDQHIAPHDLSAAQVIRFLDSTPLRPRAC